MAPGAATNPVSAADLEHLSAYREPIREACSEWGEDPNVLGGICLRETGAGFARGYKPQGSPCGWGDDPDGAGPMNPYGYGLFQIDRRYHKTFIYSEQARTVIGQARYACRVLHEARESLRHSHSWPTDANLLSATVAAYNAGPGNVIHAIVLGHSADSCTTGRNYSADVLRRAESLRAARFFASEAVC